MTNTVLLQKKIDDSGLKICYIIEKLGTSYPWFKKKMKNKVPFKLREVQILCEILNIVDLEEKDAIFFAEDVEKTSTTKERRRA